MDTPRTRHLPPTATAAGGTRAEARHLNRPGGLLGPCAAISGMHGPEGASVQQCTGATRHRAVVAFPGVRALPGWCAWCAGPPPNHAGGPAGGQESAPPRQLRALCAFFTANGFIAQITFLSDETINETKGLPVSAGVVWCRPGDASSTAGSSRLKRICSRSSLSARTGPRGGGVGQILIGPDGAGEQDGAGEGEKTDHGPECIADAEDGAESPGD
jgi:hypothetical protein